jgi:integrase
MTSPEPIRGEPKTHRGRRVVEMPSLAVDALRRHRAESTVIAPDGRVFSRPEGRNLGVQTVYARWHRLLERAGLPIVDPTTHATPRRLSCSARACIRSSSPR